MKDPTVDRGMAGALNLPGRLYCDQTVFADEQSAIFSRMWLPAARLDELPAHGAFKTFGVGADPLILLRDGDRVGAYFNICRHRGTCLVDEVSGTIADVVCPYHAWRYSLSGELIAAPKMSAVAGFERSDYPLNPVRVEEWQGFLMVNLDPLAESAAEMLADAPDLAPWSLGDLRIAHRQSYEVGANWKILVENYSECYHCARVHPHLHRISDGGGPRAPVDGRCFNGGPMNLGEGHQTMSMSGRSPWQPLPALSEEDRRLVHYYHLYPNLLLALHPDYVLVHTVWPVAADRSRVDCCWLFHPEQLAADGFDATASVTFWDLTNRQDWQLCEGVQRGVSSRGHLPGRYQSTEDCVFFFDRWYRNRMESRSASGNPGSL